MVCGGYPEAKALRHAAELRPRAGPSLRVAERARGMRFSNKTCIVSGGGSGIGRATCLQMAAEGGRVVVADLHKDAAQATVDAIVAAGGQAIAVEVDVGNSAQVQNAV